MANGLALFVLKSIMKCTGMVIDKKHANNRDVQIILSCFSDMAIAFSQRHDKFMNQKLEMIAFRMSSQYQVDIGLKLFNAGYTTKSFSSICINHELLT